MKSVKLHYSLILLGLLAFAACISAQTTAVSTGNSGSSAASANFLRLSEVREGMRGTAKTVFRGTVPEEFSVEILGVVPGGIGPKQDMIVGRISGGGADRTAVFAGMSGSPVYINGKLVGAISYSFPFSKEAICGITPIEQMVDMFEHRHPARTVAREPRSFSFAELASTDIFAGLSRQGSNGIVSGVSQGSPMMAVAGQSFQRIATPMTFTGFSQETLSMFSPQLTQAGLLPVAAAGGAAPMSPMKTANAETLVGGTSVSMQLTRGDYSLAAAGTVTLRDGDKIYAFGHPFLNLGSSDLPMSESHVVTVIPNINNSFKLAVPDAMVGSMTQDLATGVFGKLGKAPTMIPVRLNISTSRGGAETVNFEVARDEFLTPLLLNMAIYNAVTAQERGLGDTTVDIRGTIKLKGQQPLSIQRKFAGGQAQLMASGSIVAPVSVLLKSRFDDLNIEGITVDVASTDGTQMALLDRLSIDRTQVSAGETIEIQAFARTNAGKVFIQRIPVTIPKDTPAGAFKIIIGDGSQVQKEAATQYFVPATLADLIATINSLKSSDRLYAVGTRTSIGAVMGSNEMPNLPPSMIATLNNDRTTGVVKPTVQTVVFDKSLPPSEMIITGQQSVSIEIVR
ncbi:MAG: hypothetical protein ABL984_07750 [Pyrinomonadaceae bacterium]